MAYKLFERSGVRVEDPSLSLVPGGRIAFNAAAVSILAGAGVKLGVLLWDKANRKVALKAVAKNDKNSYTVSVAPGKHSASLRAKSFFRYISWDAPERTLLRAAWIEKDKMFEITLPSEFTPPSTAADPKRRAKTGS